ncbi:SLC13 family permease [Halobellus sp. Atlit-31R]|nr:SLC13 family permease [Halobellus sp. Atlit-31R]
MLPRSSSGAVDARRPSVLPFDGFSAVATLLSRARGVGRRTRIAPPVRTLSSGVPVSTNSRRRLLTLFHSRVFGLGWGLAALVVGISLPLGIDYRAQGAISVFCFAIVLWLTKPLPLSVVSVASVTLLVALGVTETFADAAAGFATRLVFFMFLLLVLGQAITKVDIDTYVASRLLSSSSTPRRSFWLLARDILVLSLFMPSGIARTVTFVPIVEQLGEQYGLEPTDPFQSSSFLLLGQLNPIASLMIMTGGGMAILSSEIIRTATPLTWLEWFLFMTPPVVIVYVLGALTISRLFRIDDDTSPRVGESAGVDHRIAATSTHDGDDDASDMRHSFTREQRLVGGVMAATILLWALGSILGLSSIVPPLLAVCFLAAPRIDIITTDDVRAVNWDILLLFGGVFSLTKVMESTGAISALVDVLVRVVPIQLLSQPAAVVAILGFVFAVRLFFSTASACLAATLPVTLSLSAVVGVDPLWLALSAVIVAGSTTLLPFHLPTVLLITEDHTTPTTTDVLALGVANLVFAAVAITLAWTFYWPLLG